MPQVLNWLHHVIELFVVDLSIPILIHLINQALENFPHKPILIISWLSPGSPLHQAQCPGSSSHWITLPGWWSHCHPCWKLKKDDLNNSILPRQTPGTPPWSGPRRSRSQPWWPSSSGTQGSQSSQSRPSQLKFERLSWVLTKTSMG